MMQSRVFSGQAVISISVCQLDCDDDIALETANSLLNKDEVARKERFVFERDRVRFARARGYLRLELGAALNVSAHDVEIEIRSGGKPYVPGAPFDFNLSHSGDLAVFAHANLGSVGVDVEMIDRGQGFGRDLDGLARSVLADSEQTALNGLKQDERALRFMQYWTAKEARMKVSGQGMRLPPRNITLALSDGVPVGYLQPDVAPVSLEYATLQDQNAVCCVAYSPTQPKEWETWAN